MRGVVDIRVTGSNLSGVKFCPCSLNDPEKNRATILIRLDQWGMDVPLFTTT